MYFIIKNIHLTAVLISISLYIFRFFTYYRGEKVRPIPKWLKTIPHINDTALFSSGVALIALTGFIPFTDAAPWLNLKLVAVFCYILSGYYALSAKQSLAKRWLFFITSIGWLITIICLAVLKNPALLF